MAQRKHLDDFLRGRIIGRLEWGRTQLEVSDELGIAQSVISRLWQRFQDDATGTTVSRQTVYRRLGNIGLYARRTVSCVPLTSIHCHLRLTWSREHALWTPQQWPCVMFSDESRFTLQSDSRRNLIWRAPGIRYHQEKTIKLLRYGGAGWLVWGGIFLGSRTDLHVQSVAMTGHIYRDAVLEQHVREYHPYGLARKLTGLESDRAFVGYAWLTHCSPSTSHLSTGNSEGIVLDEWCNIPQRSD
ncbi:transposable element Tcb1 transposase [Trichonephila clavipes]|nr:transposable element Tcb1 transposase [Trichonephila clavipes]